MTYKTAAVAVCLLILLACGGGGDKAAPARDVGHDTHGEHADSGEHIERACAVPEGAHPSVGAAIPMDGWRCTRDPRPLSSPRDVIVSRSGDVLVSEFGAGRILRIGPNTIEVVAQGLEAPIGLRELDSGELLVAEEGRQALSRIEPDSGVRTEIAGSLNFVTYLTLGPDGAAYVSSFREVGPTGTGIVWRIELDSGKASPFVTGLNVPEGLFFEDSGALRVVEWFLPSAVIGFAQGGSEGTRLSEGYEEAYGLLSDGEGGYYVGDHAGRVVWERADGTALVLLDGIGKPGGLVRTANGALLITEFVDFGATGYLVRLEPL